MPDAPPDRREYGDTSESAIRRMADIIERRFSPISVTLFGSRARGDADARSDVDLFVLMPEGTDVKSVSLEIRNALAGSPHGKDILVNTPGTFARRALLPGTVQRRVVREGVLLRGELKQYAESFMRDAGDSLRSCREAPSDERHHVRSRAYHAHRAAESALKCALALSGVDFARTHDLAELAADLPADWDVPCLGLDRLSGMWETSQHGDRATTPSKRDADWAFETAQGVVRAVRKGMTSRRGAPLPPVRDAA